MSLPNTFPIKLPPEFPNITPIITVLIRTGDLLYLLTKSLSLLVEAITPQMVRFQTAAIGNFTAQGGSDLRCYIITERLGGFESKWISNQNKMNLHLSREMERK